MGTTKRRDNLPPMPDLGPIEAIPHPDGSGAMLMNVAMTVAVARKNPTPQSAAFYRAFVEAWDRVKDMPGPDSEKQQAAAEAGFAAIGAVVVL